MASQKKLKKELQQKVAETLTTTFDGFHGQIPLKKFKRNVKKASKILLAGLKKVPTKKAAPRKKSETKKIKQLKIAPETAVAE